MNVVVAVLTGKRDERGEDVLDPIYELALDGIVRWPQIGETIAVRGGRHEVVDVINDLAGEPVVTYLVKPLEDKPDGA